MFVVAALTQASRAARLGSGGASYVRNGLFKLFWDSLRHEIAWLVAHPFG